MRICPAALLLVGVSLPSPGRAESTAPPAAPRLESVDERPSSDPPRDASGTAPPPSGDSPPGRLDSDDAPLSISHAAPSPTAPADAPADPPEPRTTNLLGLPAAPLTEPLVTDRPDFTESALAVPRGRVQLEAGYTYTHDHERGVTSTDHTFPEFLLRVGLVDDFELRLAWLGWSLTEDLFTARNDAGRRIYTKEHDDGGTDLSVGFKYHFFAQKGLRPEFGIIGELSLPTGAETKTSGDVDPGVKLLWSYDLTDRLALAGNLNFAVPTSQNGRYFQTAASVTLGASITERVGAYFEYFGIYPDNRGEDCAHSLNGGVTFLITDNFQWDIRAGFGLNEQADDFFAGTGFAIRF